MLEIPSRQGDKNPLESVPAMGRHQIELPPGEVKRLTTASEQAERLRSQASSILDAEVDRLTKLGYPQAAIARALKISRQTLHNWRAGREGG
jgi:DNA invertase Pin-like site-specific DNA recombinase